MWAKQTASAIKGLDVADGADIPLDKVYKYQAVVLCYIHEHFDPNDCTPHIRATHQKTNEVKFYDMKYNFELKDMKDQNCTPATSKMILLVKK